MSTRLRASVGLTLLLVALPSSALGVASKPPSPQSQAKGTLARLVADTRKLPASLIGRSDKAALLRAAGRVRRGSIKTPCRSIKRLGAYRRLLVKVRVPRQRDPAPTAGSERGTLESDALAVNAASLALPRTRACGGGSKARPTVTETTSRVLESDARHLRMRIALPAPTFASHQVHATDYQQMFMEGMGETGDIGKPGLPVATEFLAVPEGAGVRVKVNDTTGYDLRGVNLMPHQPEPVDQELPPIGPGGPSGSDFEADPFVKSRPAYKARAPFPARPAKGKVLGRKRNLRIGGVETNGGAYRPRARKLHVFTSVDVTVTFGGANTGHFGSAKRIT